MTASGPFAMGPTLAGRSAPRSNFALTASVSRTLASPSLKKETDDNARNDTTKTDGEYYSDPDEGVEIVDMENVHRMDWMAPDSIRKERQQSQKKIKKEAQGAFY